MTTIKTTSPQLKTEWSNADFKNAKSAIYKYFKTHFVTTMHDVPLYSIRSFNDVDNCLGMAYTSSSSFAMYSISNTEVYFDFGKEWNFVCFGIAEGRSGFVYALLHDKEEREIYFPIN